MRIHYSSPAWHGGFGEFMLKALRSLGHEVFYFDDNGTRGQKWFKRIFTRIPRKQYVADDRFREMVSRDWLRSVSAFKPDLIVLEHVPNILPDSIRRAKSDGYKIFYWADSPPAGSQAKDILAGMLLADEVFTVDRAKAYMTNLFPPSAFHHLPIAGDPDVFRPLPARHTSRGDAGGPNTQKEYDVVYVGSFSPQTGDGVMRAEIITNIPEKYKVAVFGNDIDYWFKYYPKLKARAGSTKPISATSVNEIYNKAKIVLGIYSAPGYISSLSARTHETALAGAFQIVDYRDDLDKLYPPGLLPRFEWANEVNGLIERWLARPEEREKISAKVREHALAHHTWRHRAEEMLGYFKK